MLSISVYGKDNCGKCEAAKEKIKKLGYEYEVKDLDYYMNYHQGWRDDESLDLQAWAWDNAEPDAPVPAILINREWFTYPQAMKYLKGLK